MKKTIQLDFGQFQLINESIDARIKDLTSKLITTERLDDPPQHMLAYYTAKISELHNFKTLINK